MVAFPEGCPVLHGVEVSYHLGPEILLLHREEQDGHPN